MFTTCKACDKPLSEQDLLIDEYNELCTTCFFSGEDCLHELLSKQLSDLNNEDLE